MASHFDAVRRASGPVGGEVSSAGGDWPGRSNAVDEPEPAITEPGGAEAAFPRPGGSAVTEVEDALARAERAAATVLEGARARWRADAEEQGAGNAEVRRAEDALLKAVREQATAQAEQIVADARQAAAALLQQARAEADLFRDQAMSVMERFTAVVVAQACEAAESEAMRLREEAVQEAEEVRAAIIDSARKEAQRLRSGAGRRTSG